MMEPYFEAAKAHRDMLIKDVDNKCLRLGWSHDMAIAYLQGLMEWMTFDEANKAEIEGKP